MKEPSSEQLSVYLNIGMSASCSQETLQLIYEGLLLEAKHGGGATDILKMKGDILQQARETVAELLHCDSDEVVLTSNTTYGVNLVANGFDFRYSDEVIVTDAEHYSCLVPWEILQRDKGIRLQVLSMSSCCDEEGNLIEEAFFAELESRISVRTKMVFFSHVLYMTGVELPLKRLCHWLRERGIASLIDGAQVVGHIPVDVKEAGCDYYAFTGGKWLNGPTGTGALYIRKECQDDLRNSFSGWSSVQNIESLHFYEDARRFENSTRSIPMLKGFIHAIETNQQMMRERKPIYEEMVRRIREALGANTDLCLRSPNSQHGIISFSSKTLSVQELYQTFLEKGIVARCIDEEKAVRFTIPPFLKEEEVEYVIHTCRELVAAF